MQKFVSLSQHLARPFSRKRIINNLIQHETQKGKIAIVPALIHKVFFLSWGGKGEIRPLHLCSSDEKIRHQFKKYKKTIEYEEEPLFDSHFQCFLICSCNDIQPLLHNRLQIQSIRMRLAWFHHTWKAFYHRQLLSVHYLVWKQTLKLVHVVWQWIRLIFNYFIHLPSRRWLHPKELMKKLQARPGLCLLLVNQVH